MKKTLDWVKQALKYPENLTWDAILVSIFESYVHVRLKGGDRKLITHVVIADHIDKAKLKPGRYCKISRLHDRGEGQTGKFILSDILPIPDNDGVTVNTVAKPNSPRVTVSLDCTESAWFISWTKPDNALSYILYMAQNTEGLNETQVVETSNENYSLPFAIDGFVFFAVEAIGSSGPSEKSEWTSDNKYFTDTGIIAFGDTVNHGDIISTNVRMQVSDGKVEKSTNNGVSWVDVTPTSVNSDWADVVVMTEVIFKQVIFTEDLTLVFGYWNNGSAEIQGWFWSSLDKGVTWTVRSIIQGTPTEAFPVWADLIATNVALTTWEDGTLYLLLYDFAPSTVLPPTAIAIGTCLKSEVVSETYYAFPHWAVVDDLFLAGYFEPPTLGVTHIARYLVATTTWSSIENGWGTDVAKGFKVEQNSAGDNLFYVVREEIL